MRSITGNVRCATEDPDKKTKLSSFPGRSIVATCVLLMGRMRWTTARSG